MKEKYLPAWPREPAMVAERGIAHFLIRFAAKSSPPSTLEFPGYATIDLHRQFQETVQPHIQDIPFIVGAHAFALQVFRNKDGRARHDLHFCASGRDVICFKLRDLLPELPERLVSDDQQSYTLK